MFRLRKLFFSNAFTVGHYLVMQILAHTSLSSSFSNIESAFLYCADECMQCVTPHQFLLRHRRRKQGGGCPPRFFGLSESFESRSGVFL